MGLLYRRPRHLSAQGAAFIASFEGFPREQPYNDPVGHATVGYGHLLHRGPVTPADRKKWSGITKAQARKLLQKDAERYAAAVHRLIKPKLNQAQFDALVSFTFNLGIGALEDSTLRRKLNRWPGTRRGVVGEAAKREVDEELLKWVRAGGQTLPGLVRRRKAESRLFRTGQYS